MIFLIPLLLPITLFVILPIFVVVFMSFSTAQSFTFPPPGYWLGYYRKFLDSGDWLDALRNSFIIASASTLLTMSLVTPAAFAINRRVFAGRGMASVMMMTPLMIPHIALALGFYTLFASMKIVGTHLAVVIAHTVVNIPICYLIVSATLKGFDRNVERAAANLGASPPRVFFTVTLPILRPGFLVAALFTFVASFDETTIALFIAGLDARTLPAKMFASLHLELDPVIAVVSTILVTTVFCAIVGASVFRARGERRRA